MPPLSVAVALKLYSVRLGFAASKFRNRFFIYLKSSPYSSELIIPVLKVKNLCLFLGTETYPLPMARLLESNDFPNLPPRRSKVCMPDTHPASMYGWYLTKLGRFLGGVSCR